MKKIFFLLLIFVLSSSLALAVSVTTDKTDYTNSETVTIDVLECTGTSILKVSNSNVPPDLVSITEGSADWETSYNTISDPASGKYMLFASCEDGTTAIEYFCVNEDGCLNEEDDTTDDTTSPSDDGSGPGSCRPNWDCSDWSYCDNTLTQTRTCTDLRNCRIDREETRTCLQCEESWVCSAWSACQNGINTRTCADERQCETELSKPAVQRSCQITTPPGRPPTTFPPQDRLSFWEEYRIYFIVIPLALLAIAGIVLLVMYLVKKYKKPAINHHELVDWIKKEQKMGTPEETIRKTLENTSWNKKEIDQAFQQ